MTKTVFKKTFFLILFIVLLGNEAFCAVKKSKKKTKNTEQQTEAQQEQKNQENDEYIDINNDEVIDNQAIKLPVQKRTFFYKIDEQIVKEVENGSPESLKNAMQLIKKSYEEYEENEKVLISIAVQIMKIVWPSQKISWEQPETNIENPYIGAINSAKQGIFDSSTGDVDFLSTILPALVLLSPVVTQTNELKNSYNSVFESCQNSIQKAMQFNQDSVLAHYLMGVLFQKQGNYEEALPYLKFAYDSSSKTEEILLSYCDVLYKSGNLELAQKIVQEFDSPDLNIQVLKQKAYIAFELKDYDNAELLVARVLQQNPNDLDFLLFRAKILVEKNDYIKEVKISKKLGNIIELTITEYQAVALTVDGNMILSNGTVLENTYNLTDIPIMINTIDENKTFKNFANKFGQINNNILRQISQIEYSPVEVDEDRFLLYMNDGNLVYITLTKINKLNKYDKIKDKLNGQLGIIYLDSGDYVELKKNTIATNSTTVTDPNNESDQSTDE